MKSIENYDYILSIGTFFEDEELKSSLEKACKDGTKFTYMHPIDNFVLKALYTQFIKYEVGSEEGIYALLLDTFVKNCDENTRNFINNLDLGYISAESSAGEEEFEEAYETYKNSNSKLLIIGNDIKNHERVENIIKLLSIIKKYTDFEVLFLDKELEEKLNSIGNSDLEDIADLKSFNGTLIYSLKGLETPTISTSQTFANISKVKDGEKIVIISKNEKIEKILKVDENLTGTVAILNVKNIKNEYIYKRVQIQKESN